jgi:hypothetical protein
VTREEVISRFCVLQSEVANHLNDWSNASDCFCGETVMPDGFHNDGVALAYIEKVVRDSLKQHRT